MMVDFPLQLQIQNLIFSFLINLSKAIFSLKNKKSKM